MKNNHKNVLKILSQSFIKFLKQFIISKIIKEYRLLLNKTPQIVYFKCFVSVFRV